MGFGSYNFGALSEIQQIAARLLQGFTTAQIVETGGNVIRVLENFKKEHKDKIPTKPGGGLLDMGPLPINDFELALHLVNSRNPAMTEVIESANGLPALVAYLEILTNNIKLPEESLLESALSFAIGARTLDGDVAKLWNRELQKDVERLGPLAITGQKHGVAQANRRMGKTKLSESQKRQIVREHEAAVVKYGTIKSLARKFNVSDDTIKRVLDSQ